MPVAATPSPAPAAVRPPVIAGAFYAGDPDSLRRDVAAYLEQGRAARPPGAPVPKVVIAPHAGHVYSGPVAARAYARLEPARDRIRRVVLIGPSHRVPVQGVALSGADAWRTPLGDVPIDHAWARARLAGLADVSVADPPHAQEHCLEVHLPFLQAMLGAFSLVPMVAGRGAPEQVARVLEALWGGPETAVIISSDLSHFLDYRACQSRDATTAAAIESLDPGRIGPHEACGCVAVNGLLALARARGISVERLDIRNSGDTAGARDRVVGYGAWAFFEPVADGAAADDADPIAATEALVRDHGDALVRLAAAGLDHGVRHGTPPGAVDLAKVPPPLRLPGAAFVTLSHITDGGLRGCIGSVEAHRALAQDVLTHGFDAGFRDSRFPPVTARELPGLGLSVSVLTPAVPLPVTDRDDLLGKMRPGIDGLIIEDAGRRGLFLPQVWEQVPEPARFLGHLMRKAGLPETYWSETVRVQRFETRGVKATPWAPKDTP
ncbi:AmmeMemoRadiSam system protein B [uncultured Rhodospira sp.]|uniref:AmmeMemoRadiSam system protein B n=1 Tax=uncultured Rhodospira sp. TaxID=1936189 RepID=UPI002608FA63|nr:AmmeMemoRadiSam system protein B [uncultured Rhodospira sp.]